MREEKRVVGLCSFHNISPYQRSVSIGYDLARTHWRQGIATEAVGAIIRFGFMQMNLNRIEVSTCIDDLPSVRLMERWGFSVRVFAERPPWKMMVFSTESGFLGYCRESMHNNELKYEFIQQAIVKIVEKRTG